jgi:hypothetical protein
VFVNKKRIRSVWGGLLGLAAAVVAPVAFAGVEWEFTSTSPVTVSGVKATAQAVSFTNGGTSNNRLAAAQLFFYSGNGFGVRNADCCTGDPGEDSSPEHSVDNEGRSDYVLLSFSEAVNLTQVTMGWRNNDSDLSILAFNNGTLPASMIGTSSNDSSGMTHSQLQTAGWQLIGNYSGPTGSTSDEFSINTNTTYASKYWLVGGYDDRWALNGLTNPTGLGTGNDFVKILALYGNKTTGVPEPNALLLLGVAMAGLWATRRKVAL